MNIREKTQAGFLGAARGKPCHAMIITGETGQLQYYREVARRLIANGLTISLCCDRDDPGVGEAVAAAAAEVGAGFYHHRGDRGPEEEVAPAWKRGLAHVSAWVAGLERRVLGAREIPEFDAETGAPFAQLAAMRKYHEYRMRDAWRVLRQSRPDVLVLGEDGIAVDFWAITVAKKMKIPVVVLPYGMADSTSLVWKGLEQKSEEGGIVTSESPGGKYIERHYPHWFKETRFGKTLYFPPTYIIAMEEFGIRIPRPWCFQGGVSDLILIEGPEMQDRYHAEGVDPAKIVQVGAVYSDVIHDVLESDSAYMRAYREKIRIDPDAFRVLVCVPSNEATSWRAEREFYSIEQYLLALRTAFARLPGIELTFSFHPRMSAADRARLKTLGFESSSEFVVSLIAKSDVVITCHSSVTRWALVAGKPVIDFDLQQFHSNFFPDCAGFLFCSRFSEVSSALERLATDASYYTECAEACLTVGARFGPVDGRAAERIGAVLTGLPMRGARTLN